MFLKFNLNTISIHLFYIHLNNKKLPYIVKCKRLIVYR